MGLELFLDAIREHGPEVTYNLYNYGMLGAVMGLLSTYLSNRKTRKESALENISYRSTQKPT